MQAIIQTQIIDALSQSQAYYLLYMPSITNFEEGSAMFEELSSKHSGRHFYVWLKNNLIYVDKHRTEFKLIFKF